SDSATDVDNGATLGYGVSESAGTFGDLQVDGVSGEWTYTLNDEDPDTNGLGGPAGLTAVETFTYTVTDEHGASATATLTVTIEGSNDSPTAEDIEVTEVVTEDSGSTV